MPFYVVMRTRLQSVIDAVFRTIQPFIYYEGSPVIVEDEVTVGHNVILHGCTVKKRCIIGMGSTILDGAVIGEECIIGANTLIPSGKVIPPRSLVIGSPGKVVRELTDKDFELIQLSIDTYVEKSYIYNNIFKK